MKMTAEKLQALFVPIKAAENWGCKSKVATLPVGTIFWNMYYMPEVENLKTAHVLTAPATLRLSDIDNRGICGYVYCRAVEYGKKESTGISEYFYLRNRYVRISWKQIVKNKELVKGLLEYIEKVTPKYTVTKEKGVIQFVNEKTGEKLFCDLGKQEFTRTYKKGKPKQIRYPAQFFKYVSGRLLAKSIQDADCKTFSTLVQMVTEKYPLCKNFGTFLVRMFDHQHLEAYISAGVKFQFDIPFNYTDFSKDIRKRLNEEDIYYGLDVGSLFCSEIDTGRAIFAQIKDCLGFRNMVQLLAYNIQPLNTLVNHYNYDLKTLFTYCRERKWTSGVRRYYYYDNNHSVPCPENTTDAISTYDYDLITTLRDYSRMALDVYGEAYDKYPKDLKDAHDTVSKLHQVRQMGVDAKKFEETIDKALEWKNKEFSIVYPKKAEDVIAEGQKLRHCVGSYIQSVIRGECKILFLRKNDALDVPFVTIEIQGGNIRQARAAGNANPTYDARMALQDYAKEKKMLYT